MGLPTLKTKERTTFGKTQSKQLRKNGQIPAVIYGEKQEPSHVTLDPRDIQRVFKKSEKGRNTIINLEIEGNNNKGSETVIAYQIQEDAVTRAFEHIDFIRISDNSKVRAIVPVKLIGNAPGLKLGGVLVHKLREIVVSCLPKNIPSSIDVDMTRMNVNSFFKVQDLTVGNVTILSNLDDTIVRIAAPRTAVEVSEDEDENKETEEVPSDEERQESADSKE